MPRTSEGETGFEAVLTAFVDQYGLPRGEVLDVIVDTVTRILSKWHQMEISVVYSDGRLQAVGYSRVKGKFEDSNIDLRSMRGWNTIKWMIENNMDRAVCVREARAFKNHEHELRWGEILKHDNKRQKMIVEISMDDGVTLLAECPYSRIGKHERTPRIFENFFSRGSKRAFHLRRIDPVLLNGTPRLRIILDRESKRLPQALLCERLIAHRYIMSGFKLFCYRRIVGGITFIRVNKPIPREAIMETTMELNGERIKIDIDKRWI